MNGEKLLEVLNDADPAFVEAAERAQASKRKARPYRVAAVCAAAFLAVSGITAAVWYQNKVQQPKFIVRRIPSPTDQQADECMPLEKPHWEDMGNYQRYAELSFEDNTYTTALIAVHEADIGELLGTAEVTGQDIYYTGEIHTDTVSVYAINGISTEAAVCIRFHEDDEYPYAYCNGWYTPETLGAFLDGLDLAARLETDLVYDPRDPKQTIVYEDVPTERIFEALLSARETPNEPDVPVGGTVLEISASLNVLGCHNHVIALTEDGYLWTNLLESGKYFHIGEETVAAFVREVTEQHQGYIYEYLTLTGEPDGEPE